MRSIIFLAPPAGGKGTISEMVCDYYNIPHISTGDLLREEVNNKTNVGLELKNIMEQGKLVEDKYIYNLLENRLKKSDCSNGYVLDGFPRNVNQADKYSEILKKLGMQDSVAILLDVPKEICIKRIVGRRTCSKCGKIYNLYNESMKPNNDGLCDICNMPLTKRNDDTEETYEIRYQEYMDKTEPLINYYNEKGNLISLDGSMEKEETFKKIKNFLEEI